eukprot:m.320471 g.320471  ORF g.320471 m.320471 type:complete len:67 (+) comp20320_c0_seq7:335-535(+)
MPKAAPSAGNNVAEGPIDIPQPSHGAQGVQHGEDVVVQNVHHVVGFEAVSSCSVSMCVHMCEYVCV